MIFQLPSGCLRKMSRPGSRDTVSRAASAGLTFKVHTSRTTPRSPETMISLMFAEYE